MEAERKRGPKPRSKEVRTPLVGIPPAPKGLDAGARAHWKRVTKMVAEAGLLSRLDGPALELYISLWVRWREAEDKVKTESAVITAPNGYRQANPWYTVSVQCLKDMRTLLNAFGLTPAARSKLTLAEPEAVDEKWGDLQ